MVLVRGSVHSQPQPCHAENHDVENLCKEPPDRLQDVIDAQAGTVIAGSGLMKPILAIQFALGVILASWFPIRIELVDTAGQRKSTKRRHTGQHKSTVQGMSQCSGHSKGLFL